MKTKTDAHVGRTFPVSTKVKPRLWAAFCRLCDDSGVSRTLGIERALMEVVSAGRIPDATRFTDDEEETAQNEVAERVNELKATLAQIQEELTQLAQGKGKGTSSSDIPAKVLFGPGK